LDRIFRASSSSARNATTIRSGNSPPGKTLCWFRLRASMRRSTRSLRSAMTTRSPTRTGSTKRYNGRSRAYPNCSPSMTRSRTGARWCGPNTQRSL